MTAGDPPEEAFTMSRLLIPLAALPLLVFAAVGSADPISVQGSGNSKDAACDNGRLLAQATARNLCGAKGVAQGKFEECVCKEHPSKATNGTSSPPQWDCTADYDYTCGQ
jgi:hypothetical protein